MRLIRLEIQGFKTFARKTRLDFPIGTEVNHAVSVIVGPNGSGKSNLVDAVRWCLGEQSMKLLRGKKTEDMIFSGSTEKSRAGFAEVVLTFDNHDKAIPIEYEEVELSRRQYRDGSSEYRLNGKIARLTDIQILLAEAGIGERSYTVIAQGMIDHVLISSPEERKLFFDDATGVRGLQMKRHQALLRLGKASEHLLEVEHLLAEAEPRLRILGRQVKRLEKRETVERELETLSVLYYGTLCLTLSHELEVIANEGGLLKGKISTKTDELKTGDEQLLAMEKQEREKHQPKQETNLAQIAYREIQQSLKNAREEVFRAQRAVDIASIKAERPPEIMPINEIEQEIASIKTAHENIYAKLKQCHEMHEVAALMIELESVITQIIKLHERLKTPESKTLPIDPALVQTLEKAKNQQKQIEEKEKEVEGVLANAQNATPDASATSLFAFQRTLRKLQSDLYELEQQRNEIELRKARVETRLEGLGTEIQEQCPTLQSAIHDFDGTASDTNPAETHSTLLRLRHERDIIGSIDEETLKEYESTNERVTFLQKQFSDLSQAISSTEQVVDELDTRIQKQSEEIFKQINKEFQKYFTILFGGGTAELLKTQETKNEEAPHVSLDRAFEEEAEAQALADGPIATKILERFQQRKETIMGIEIQASPPGKRQKSLNLLSGGERALTSLALLCAIMATHPSPFVVLDEVDAALDESNTVRFANILDELRKFSQFIIITHNRATMERADKLFGVSMGEDGISNLLSVSLQDIEESGNARR
ncbi:MAG: AAA family ATPase [Patescibacteria group bacterium]|jgi:chromosome segregation protein